MFAKDDNIVVEYIKLNIIVSHKWDTRKYTTVQIRNNNSLHRER